MTANRYQVAISYHRESKRRVLAVARALAEILGKQNVFLDVFHPDAFVGAKSKSVLQNIFTEQADLVVPFFSLNYNTPGWSGLEWDAIVKLRDLSTVLPVKLSDVTIPQWPGGSVPILAYEGRMTSKQIATAIIAKLPVIVEPPPGEPPPGSVSLVESGFIIAADIWEFTNLPSGKMEAMIDLLWRVAYEVGLEKDTTVSSLEGMLIVLRDGNYEDITEKCKGLVSRFSEEAKKHIKNGAEIRVAIHRGDFYRVPSRKIVVGSGPSECGRLVRLAGPGQIVLSEDFIIGWKKDIGEQNTKDLVDLYPAVDSEPMSLSMRASGPSYFRFYAFGLDSPFVYPQLIQAHAAEELLIKILEEIEDEFVDIVSDAVPGLTFRKIGARVSIFIPNRHEKDRHELISTNLRYVRPKNKKSTTANKEVPSESKKGNTTYRVSLKEPPEGPIGLAFMKKEVMIQPNLPSYKPGKSDCEYVRIMSSPPWNIEASKVHGFGKHARTFMAVPCWINDKAPTAEAVICIDTHHPLKDVSEELLRDLGEGFGRYFGAIIAALLLIRY